MRLRFSSRMRVGAWRYDVATGMERLAVMFSAIRAAAPRNGSNWSPGPTALTARAVATGLVSGTAALATTAVADLFSGAGVGAGGGVETAGAAAGALAAALGAAVAVTGAAAACAGGSC